MDEQIAKQKAHEEKEDKSEQVVKEEEIALPKKLEKRSDYEHHSNEHTTTAETKASLKIVLLLISCMAFIAEENFWCFPALWSTIPFCLVKKISGLLGRASKFFTSVLLDRS